MKRVFILIFIFLMTFSAVHAAVDIKGRIIDLKTKQPVEFVTMVLLKSDSSYVAGCQTDQAGAFRMGGQFQKEDYLLKASYMGYRTIYVKLSNVSSSVDLGDIELEEDAKALSEVVVTGQRIINKVDRQIILPDSMQMATSVNAFDLLSNMSLARLNIDPINQTIKMGTEGVQLRINGVRATVQEVAALRSKDVLRVEFFEDPGVRFGNEDVGAVVNLIVDRQKNYGGYVSFDGRNAPFVGFGDDYLTFKTNYKASEFGFNYFLNYRSYNDRWTDISESLNFPDNPIVREQRGQYAPMEYQYHNFNLSYNLTVTDKYVFNVVFKNMLYKYDNESLYHNLYSDMGQSFSKNKNRGDEYIPALDIYYRRELKNKQSLTFNVVGTYISSDSKRAFTEWRNVKPETDIYNHIEGSKYSVIGEAIYEKQFEKLTFSAGAKHTYGVSDNTYEGDTNAKTKMKNADTYAFAQIQGKIAGKLGYTLGAGATRIWFEEGDKDATHYSFRPSVQLSYPFNDNLTLKYSFSVNTRTPWLGEMSNVEQQTDSYQITRGNPNLKPWNTYANKLTLSYSKGMFDISSIFGYTYFDNPIINAFSIENDKIISFSDNHKGQHYLYWNGDISAKLIKDIWTVSCWFNLSRDIFKSNMGEVVTYNGSFFGIRSNLMYKNWHLVMGVDTRFKDLWGYHINYGEDWNYVEAGYKYKEAKLSVGMSYPFKDRWSAGGKNVSSVKPSESWSNIKENGHMLYLRFSWNMSFGRKHEAGKKTLDNADSDKGIL